MRTTGGLLGTVAVIALVSAGCGGGGSGQTADVQALAVCIANHSSPSTPLQVSTEEENLDLIARKAGVGGVQVLSPHNELQIAAERSEGDAEATASQYENFSSAFGSGHIERVGTVVLAYSKTPIPEESQPVEMCLADQGIE
jgi:hypothetical protein